MVGVFNKENIPQQVILVILRFQKNLKIPTIFYLLNVCDTSPTDCALTVASWNALTTKTAQIYQGYNGSTQTMPLMWIAVGCVN